MRYRLLYIRRVFTLMIALGTCAFAQAQGDDSPAEQPASLAEQEDSLLKVAPLVISAPSDSAKFAVATQLQQTLMDVLSKPASFDYEFSNLRMSTVAIASHPFLRMML